MKMKKTVIAVTLCAALLSGCTNTEDQWNSEELKEVVLENMADNKKETPELSEDIAGGVITSITDEESSELDKALKGLSFTGETKIEEREWSVYSCAEAKDKLTSAEVSFYDRLDKVCSDYLKNSMYEATEFSDKKVMKGAKYSDLNLSAEDAANVAFWFRLNNPQYFFLNNSLFYSSNNIYFHLGSFMDNISDPAKTANELFAKLEGWTAECGNETTTLGKIRAINKKICENTAYATDEENEEYRSAYSVLNSGNAVCMGYALAFCAMSNALEINAYTAQSDSYFWNVVKFDDGNYYYVDACLNDDGNGISESYIGAGTDYFSFNDDNTDAHVYSDEVSDWLPQASKDDYGCFSDSISAPEIKISGSGSGTVKLEWTAVENAVGYEYLVSSQNNIVSIGITDETQLYVTIPSGAKSAELKLRTLSENNGITENSKWKEMTVLADTPAGKPAAPSEVKAEKKDGVRLTWKGSADDVLFLKMNGTLTEVSEYYYSDGKNGIFLKGFEPTEDSYFRLISVNRSGNIEVYSDPATFKYSPDGSLTSITGVETGRNIMKKYDDGVYVGDLTDGLRNGFGTMTYSNGNVYKGEWSNDMKNGEGKFTGIDGMSYDGEFVDGQMTGSGKMTTRYGNGDVSIIEGEFVDSEPAGNIKMNYTYADGTSFEYEGEYKDGDINGNGVKTTVYTNGNITEDSGVFAKGNLVGTGIRTVKYNSGNVYIYEGDFVDGQFTCTGKRTINYKSGHKSVIEGPFENGDANGVVKLTYNYARGSTFVYEGEYSNGAMNGEGIKTTENTDNTRIVEEGTFKGDKLYNGTYVYYNSDGSVRTNRQYVNGQAR